MSDSVHFAAIVKRQLPNLVQWLTDSIDNLTQVLPRLSGNGRPPTPCKEQKNQTQKRKCMEPVLGAIEEVLHNCEQVDLLDVIKWEVESDTKVNEAKKQRQTKGKAQTEMLRQTREVLLQSSVRELYGSGCSERNWNLGRISTYYENNDTTRLRAIPDDPIEEWGFDADAVLKELEEIEEYEQSGGKYVVRRWDTIAKELGNEWFQSLGQRGALVKKLLASKYPDRVPQKVRIPENPKEEWGFTAGEAIAKIQELESTQLNNPQAPKPSLSLVARLLEDQKKQNQDSPPFSKGRMQEDC